MICRQLVLLEEAPWWEKLWRGMPEYSDEDLAPYRSIKIHFRNLEDQKAFEKFMKQKITDKTNYLWYPKAAGVSLKSKVYVNKTPSNPKYPIYIISKGRWESRLTSKALERMNVPYHIVVEPQEYDNYAAVIDPEKIFTLPFSNLGQGSIPARNWVWEHSVSIGAERHWIFDDNIHAFTRRNHNLETEVLSGSIFKAAESFVDRYTNVALAGFQYEFLAPRKYSRPALILNTRIYSCILIKNDIPYKWRGRYNEDTDLSIRALKDGYCTVLFYTFLADKSPTMTMKGGNTDELYVDDGRLDMAKSLQEQHPDITTINDKWGRWQHQVDYSSFKNNKLILKKGIKIPDGVDEFGMELGNRNNGD